jgi:hypothetical protein
VQVAIITTPRDPEYVYETIAQIEPTLPAGTTLEVFSDDPTYRVSGVPVRMHWMPESLWAIAKDMKRGQRACLNFLTALQSGWGDIVLFEDDIRVKADWRQYLAGIIGQSGADLVSLYWPEHEHLEDETQHGLGYRWRWYKEPVTFHGSLGLWVNERARIDLTHLIQSRLSHQKLLPFDNMVAMLLNHHDGGHEMVAAVPALVDHRGEVSAIPENRDHGMRNSPGY